GLGLYTVRAEMEKSVEATLARIAKIGYREVEFAGYFGKSPAEIAAILKTNGLTSPSVHVPLADLRTKLDQALDAAATIGHKYIVCPYLDESERGAADNWRRVAADNNKAAEAAKKRGMEFAYHNHAFEFEPLTGTTGMSILLAEFDPKLVKFEMDLYWMTKAKQDPVAFFEKYPGRVPLVHVKDMATDGSFADVGTGTIDFARIFVHASQAGIKHYYVENDQPTDVFANITTSYAALRKLQAR
ncbi:MAG: sugar phosphate isomerase/epimerase, partial [Gemmatimonadaceae bacterium]